MRGSSILLVGVVGGWLALVAGGSNLFTPACDVSPCGPAPCRPTPARPRPKPIATLYVHMTDGCVPCAKLKQSLQDPVVQAELHGRREWEVIEYGTEASRVVGIATFPTMIVMVDGHEIARTVGYKTPQQLAAWLNGLRLN